MRISNDPSQPNKMGNPEEAPYYAQQPQPPPYGAAPPPGYVTQPTVSTTYYEGGQSTTYVQQGGIPITGGTTVVVTSPGVMLSPDPVPIQCPNCQQQIVTQVEYDSGSMTWLVAAGLFFFGCALGCCLIPFCVDGCKDAIHSCPNCKVVVGRYRRL